MEMSGLIAETPNGTRTQLKVQAYVEKWGWSKDAVARYFVQTNATGVNGNPIRHKYYQYATAQECGEAFLDLASQAGWDVARVSTFINGGTRWLQYGR
jgi:hypothetical protein